MGARSKYLKSKQNYRKFKSILSFEESLKQTKHSIKIHQMNKSKMFKAEPCPKILGHAKYICKGERATKVSSDHPKVAFRL